VFVLLYSWSVATGIDCNREHMSRVVCYKKLERCVVVMTVTKHVIVAPNPHWLCDVMQLCMQFNVITSANQTLLSVMVVGIV